MKFGSCFRNVLKKRYSYPFRFDIFIVDVTVTSPRRRLVYTMVHSSAMPVVLPAAVCLSAQLRLKTRPEQWTHLLFDATAHVRKLFLARRRQLNVITSWALGQSTRALYVSG